MRVPRKWSGLSVGTHNYSCGRTESVHHTLSEMKEKTTIIAVVVTNGWEQRKRTFYLHLSRRAVSSLYNLLYQGTGARCTKPFQKEKHRGHLYCGRA